jgi:hypothetical protein
MKLILISLFGSVLAITGLHAAPEARNISLKVKVDGKATYKGDSVTQTRNLLLSLSLWGKEPAPNLVVKWTIYGHDRKGHDPVVIKGGEIKAGLEAGKSVELATPVVTIKGVREHTVSTGSGRGGRSKGGSSRRLKKVPASGQEYFGYSAVVMSGSTIVAEAYSSPSFKTPNPR